MPRLRADRRLSVVPTEAERTACIAVGALVGYLEAVGVLTTEQRTVFIEGMPATMIKARMIDEALGD